jgi:lipopolysaccharide biosynthesis protein
VSFYHCHPSLNGGLRTSIQACFNVCGLINDFHTMNISADTPPTAERVPPRLIAFYLTQFHPTPENDLWWGKGFTEWTNVTKARPLFEGHYQPYLPSDLGFYDLRLRETRRDQIKMAKQYGIDGFCYHYYWFSGTRLLNQPLDDILADLENDMPFCLCWANESWTRRWDAADHEVLIAQKYLPDDDLNFIKSLVPFFADNRYIRVDGKPFLIVYRPQHLPDACNTARVWRQYCQSIGLGEIHICAALTHGNMEYTKFGFDSGVEFPPHNLQSSNINNKIKFHHAYQGNVLQYASIAQSYLDRRYGSSRVFKTVFPCWDNTARAKDRSLVVLNGIPENYEYWLSSTIDIVQRDDEFEQMVFINAWNEWAEGCHLEPSQRSGHGFLQATLNAKSGLRRFSTFADTTLPHVSGQHQRKFWKDLGEVVSYHVRLRIGNLKLVVNRKPWLRLMLLSIVKAIRRIISNSGK